MPKTVAGVRALMENTRSLVINGELLLYGTIDSWPDYDYVRAIDVIVSLVELANLDRIVVRINSPGGSVIEGLAIYNALKSAGKPIDIKVDAYAGSIASAIAMAGDTITMAENATLMIHNPYAYASGDAEELRSAADEVERMQGIMAAIYAQRSGLSLDEITALMATETTFSAAEAVAAGFADSIATSLQIAACARLDAKALARHNAPISIRAAADPKLAARAANTEETQMPHPSGAAQNDAARLAAARAERERCRQIRAATTAAGLDEAFAEALIDEDLDLAAARVRIEAKATQSGGGQVDPVAIRAAATAAERARVADITSAVRAAKLEPSFADELIRGGATLDQARAQIIDKWAERETLAEGGGQAVHTRQHIVPGADGIDKFVAGATAGLLARAGLKGERNEFTGLTMVELARKALDVRGEKAGHMNRMEMVGAAFTVRASGPGYHGTSDFGFILQNVAHKAMMTGYEEVEETFDLWTGRGTASDFRPISRVDMGLFPSLSKIEEGGEYTYATIGDSGTVVQVATYGKMFAITRQAVINDDLQFFDRLPRRMGRAAKRTIGNLVYAALTGNPTMQDGVALFHANHGNLAGTAAAISVTSLGVAEAAMAVQQDEQGVGTGAGVVPKFLLVPPTQKMLADTVINSATIPGDAGQVKNPVQGLVTTIRDSRLTGTAWYLAADPSQTDTIEVTYLDGNDLPFLDQREGWSVDGTEFKVRIDAGVKSLHWRGLYKNPGV